MTEFEKAIKEIVLNFDLGSGATIKQAEEDAIILTKYLITLARKQIAGGIDVDAMVVENYKKYAKVENRASVYKAGIEDTLKAIKGE